LKIVSLYQCHNLFRSVHDLPHAIVRVWQSVPITLDPPASRFLDRALSNHNETSIPITDTNQHSSAVLRTTQRIF